MQNFELYFIFWMTICAVVTFGSLEFHKHKEYDAHECQIE